MSKQVIKTQPSCYSKNSSKILNADQFIVCFEATSTEYVCIADVANCYSYGSGTINFLVTGSSGSNTQIDLLTLGYSTGTNYPALTGIFNATNIYSYYYTTSANSTANNIWVKKNSSTFGKSYLSITVLGRTKALSSGIENDPKYGELGRQTGAPTGITQFSRTITQEKVLTDSGSSTARTIFDASINIMADALNKVFTIKSNYSTLNGLCTLKFNTGTPYSIVKYVKGVLSNVVTIDLNSYYSVVWNGTNFVLITSDTGDTVDITGEQTVTGLKTFRGGINISNKDNASLKWGIEVDSAGNLVFTKI